MRRIPVLLSAIVVLIFLSIGVIAQQKIDGAVKQPVPPLTEPTPKFNPCCPPINPNVVAENLVYKGSGSISAPYTLKFQPTATFKNQMQAYINYVNTMNPAINKITVEWRLHDQGTGSVPMTFPTGSSPGNNGPLVESDWTTWTAGGAGNPTIAGVSNFFGTSTGTLASQFPMKINNWYMIHTGTYFENGGTFFSKECAENDIFVRIQVLGIAKGANPVLELRDAKGENIGRKELK